jgi:FtsX-like permease family protein
LARLVRINAWRSMVDPFTGSSFLARSLGPRNVRAEGRQHELTIRAALGASKARIAGGLLAESSLLALLGCALGLVLAYGVLQVLVTLAPTGLPRINEIAINGPAVLFTLVLSMFVSLVFGCVPIFKYAGARELTALRESGRSMSESRKRHRARGMLVVVQVALALVLLVSSALMIRTFRALTKVDPGFTTPSEIQTFRVDIPDTMREALAAGRRRSRDRYPGRGIRRCFASIGKTGTGSIAVRLMSGFGDDFAQMRPIEPNRGRS